MKKHALAATLVAAITLPAMAEGVYVFGDLAQVKIETDIDSGFYAGKADTGLNLGVGKKINETYSAELAYRDLLSYSIADDYSKDAYKVNAVQISVLAQKPISDTVSVFGRLGFAKINIKDKYTDSMYGEYNYSDSQSENKAIFGIGASYAINSQFALRGEFSKYAKIESSTISAFSFGATYSF